MRVCPDHLTCGGGNLGGFDGGAVVSGAAISRLTGPLPQPPSGAPTRRGRALFLSDDRTGSAPLSRTTQQVTVSWSNGGNPEDRTPCEQATTSTSRIAESWSSAGNRCDRTRLATVDIRQGSNGAESWSNTQEGDDRTRSVGVGRRRRMTMSSGSDCGCGRFRRSWVRRLCAGRECRHHDQRNPRGPAGREVEDD